MPETELSLTLIAKIESLGAFTQFARQGGLEAALPAERLNELDLLIEEILMNVFRYGYPPSEPGTVTVSYRVPAPGELLLEVADQGREFNLFNKAMPDLTLDLEDRPIGGLGIFLIKQYAEPLDYRREQGWNRLTFGISTNS